VTIAAIASDNVGVAGVQFQLNGTNLGAEDTTAPYSVSWNTMTVANGVQTLTAVARDAAGNQTTSSAISVSLNNSASASEPTATFSIPVQGGQSWLTTGTTQSVSTGYARVQQDTGNSALSGLAIFGFRQAGILVTETAVPASTPISSGRIYVDLNGPVNTGIAFANANSEAAVISFYFTDTAGTDFGQGSFTLNGNRQMSAFLNQAPFNGNSPMRGTFTFNSSVPVGVIAIRGFANERSDFLITTLPVSPIGDTNSNTIVLPHFADGGGWTTQVVLTNPTNSSVTGFLQFYGPGTAGQNAPLLGLSINGAFNSIFYYTISPRSAVRLVTGGTLGQPTQIGSVRITPMASMAPTATSIFSFMTNGITVSEAGVSALPTGLVFRMYAEASGVSGQIASVESGMAIVNPSQSSVTVNVEVMRMDGSSPVPPVTLTVPANGQIAKFIRELFTTLPAPFYGFLKATASAPIGVAGLRGRYNERRDFLITTTQPRNEDQMLPASQLVFPHIVSGGGYTTQFTIFGQSSTGRLWFNSQNGAVLATSSLQRMQ
jgi:hypothetical protein